MKKLFLLIVGFALSHVAQANLPKFYPDCDTLGLSIDELDEKFDVIAYWKSKATFPSPSMELSAGRNNEEFAIECPSLSVSNDGNMVEIKGKDYNSLVKKMPGYFTNIPLYGYSGYKYQYIKKGFFADGYSLNLKNFKINSKLIDIKENSQLGINSLVHIPNSTVIGYKVNGSELKPLIYNGFVSKYSRELQKADIIDLYHTSDSYVKVKRIFIDKPNATIRIYRNYPFPTK